jgi:hypothetical protein
MGWGLWGMCKAKARVNYVVIAIAREGKSEDTTRDWVVCCTSQKRKSF